MNSRFPLVTYHRFLRFYPDGTVIALLTTDQWVAIVDPSLVFEADFHHASLPTARSMWYTTSNPHYAPRER